VVGPVLLGVFQDAALPQKTVMILLLGAVPAILVAAISALRASRRRTLCVHVITLLGMAGPGLALGWVCWPEASTASTWQKRSAAFLSIPP